MSLPTVSDYSMLEKIGSGSYATVYKAFKKVRIDFFRFEEYAYVLNDYDLFVLFLYFLKLSALYIK